MIARRRAVLVFLIAAVVLALAVPAMAQTTVQKGQMIQKTPMIKPGQVIQKTPTIGETRCPPELREELARALAEKDESVRREIQEKYRYCAKEGAEIPGSESARYEYCGRLVYAGSLYYERLRCCGYEPQKKLFNCPVEIRQPGGFGAYPVPGSYEYVLSCVHVNNAWQPVALDRVHLTNAQSGGPDWYTAVTAKAGGVLAEMKLEGQTFRARSILSWNLTPKSDCDFQPIWGNVIEYKIRLDPTDVAPPAPAGKIVFVSSQLFDGNFGGGQKVLGHLQADQRCQDAASAAGLSGSFKAWISGRVDTGAGPLPHGVVDRFTQSTVPYKLVNGVKVADDWADLTDGSLDHAIDVDEHGNPVGGETRVWTNTRTNATAWDNGTQCAQGIGPDDTGVWTWTCGSPSWTAGDCAFQAGKYGQANSTGSSWTGTSSSNIGCTNQFHLYCFEQ